jgi:transcriptional regulator with XRE-family HTH domain
MLSVGLGTVGEVQSAIASRFRAQRLAMNLPQRDLANRAGVTLASLKRFERQGLISLTSLLSLAMALGFLDEFERLAAVAPPDYASQSLDALLEVPKARRRATGTQGRVRGL